MATLHFQIRTVQKDKLAPVYLRFSVKRGSVFNVRTGYQVDPQYWSRTKEEITSSIVENGIMTPTELADQRKKFIDLRFAVQSEFNNLIGRGGHPSREWLESVIDKFNNPEQKPDKAETLNTYWQRFIREMESGEKLHGNGMKYRPSTIKSHKGTWEQFKQFQGRKKFDFDDITMDLYNDLLRYFNKKNYTINTSGRHIKNLKVVMRSAREEGLHKNQEIDRKGFKVLRATVENVYLTAEEVKRMTDLDLSAKSAWNLARDIFLIGCHTAQRFSDYSRITPEMIRILPNGNKVIDLVQRKTGQKVTVPVKPALDALLLKYDYRTPHTWDQKVNKYIKLVAQKAEIDDPIQVEHSKGGLVVKTTVPKYELIKTHTARRTGCTLMHLAGIPSISIMKLSGHKTEKEFLKYINVSEEETATVLSEHPYFNKPQLKIVG